MKEAFRCTKKWLFSLVIVRYSLMGKFCRKHLWFHQLICYLIRSIFLLFFGWIYISCMNVAFFTWCVLSVRLCMIIIILFFILFLFLCINIFLNGIVFCCYTRRNLFVCFWYNTYLISNSLIYLLLAKFCNLFVFI